MKGKTGIKTAAVPTAGQAPRPRAFFSAAPEDPLEVRKPSLLLHSCCGPCSTAVVERLKERYRITLFFYNPNITDPEEYRRRKETLLQFIEHYNCSPDREESLYFLEGAFEPDVFRDKVRGQESLPEGGRRCTECFRMRLERTAETAMLGGFDAFGTTLSVSPHKDAVRINKLGMDLALRFGLSFVAEDFKKRAGYQRSVELSRKYGLYRQRYCGCEFSK